MSALLLIFLLLVFFFIFKFTAALVAIVGNSYWDNNNHYTRMRLAGNIVLPKEHRDMIQTVPNRLTIEVDSDLKQIVGDLQEMRFELEEVEPYLRDVEFLKYARQNRKTAN